MGAASTGAAHFEKADVFELWRQLSLLPKTYEDVWREWFLPTALGELASAPWIVVTTTPAPRLAIKLRRRSA